MKKIAEDIIILHMRTKNHNHVMYGSWDMEWDTEFFLILGHFLHFYHLPLTDPKNHNLKKNEKNAWRYYPLIHRCVP